MSSIFEQILRFGLTMSLMDRELFVSKVSEFLEQYRNDPEMMEKISQRLYQYLEEVKQRMEMKDLISSALESRNLPTNEDVRALTKAIEKLTQELQKNRPTE
ncbi:MAG: phasin family protein [Flavobacteriales bacterium]|nr:phasin family protein [Flavobacteriales bacterium]